MEEGISYIGKDRQSDNDIMINARNDDEMSVNDSNEISEGGVSSLSRAEQRAKRSVESTQEIGNKLYEILKGIERRKEDNARDRKKDEEDMGYSYEHNESNGRRTERERGGIEGKSGRQTFVYVKPKEDKREKRRKLIFLGKIDKELQRRGEEHEKPEVQILLDAIRRASELLFHIDD